MTAVAQAVLDTSTYEAAWIYGCKMPIEEAITFAMSGDER
jgi:hypothetical protein